jgi:uncharacterized SAM-binding protein YcdF (DUF218 family)
MVPALLSVLKLIGTPGSIRFLLLCVLAGMVVLRLWPHHRRVARLWLAFVTLTYLVMALPAVATTLAGRLPRPETQPPAVARTDILVVFDGDNRRGRVRVAQQIFQTEAPDQVWVLGEPWMLDALATVGLPPSRLFLDDQTSNTRDQMARVERFVAERPTSRVGIIVSRLQAPRVAALAARHGVPALLIVSPIDHEPPMSGVEAFVPRYIALRVTRDALYEHAALAYYHWRGWIG